MATSKCYVTASDYAQYWGKSIPKPKPVVHAYEGPDRRIGVADRRAPGHERRWQMTEGRRRHVVNDRRRHVQNPSSSRSGFAGRLE
jgi:hypothetical protein